MVWIWDSQPLAVIFSGVSRPKSLVGAGFVSQLSGVVAEGQGLG